MHGRDAAAEPVIANGATQRHRHVRRAARGQLYQESFGDKELGVSLFYEHLPLLTQNNIPNEYNLDIF